MGSFKKIIARQSIKLGFKTFFHTFFIFFLSLILLGQWEAAFLKILQSAEMILAFVLGRKMGKKGGKHFFPSGQTADNFFFKIGFKSCYIGGTVVSIFILIGFDILKF